MDYNSIDLYRRLGDIIVKKMDIEWMKGSMYNPQDRYKVFPCLNIKFHFPCSRFVGIKFKKNIYYSFEHNCYLFNGAGRVLYR